MKPASLLPLLFLLSLTTHVRAAEQLVPAGTLIQCTLAEPKLSSKTLDVGDPVLCQVGRVALYGRSAFPYGSYLEGRFEDYKDPGHLVGKGWMELKFDRLILQPDTVLPLAAKVVDVPKYPVDKLGRIHGTGHAVRDVVEWSLPILWPIDLINLPRRGPRPTLKAETRITLKIMEDFDIPLADSGFQQSNALPPQPPQPAPIERRVLPPPSQPLAPISYADTPAPRVVAPPVLYGYGNGYPPAPPPPYVYGYRYVPYGVRVLPRDGYYRAY